jgi:hypothetical protein
MASGESPLFMGKIPYLGPKIEGTEPQKLYEKEFRGFISGD